MPRLIAGGVAGLVGILLVYASRATGTPHTVPILAALLLNVGVFLTVRSVGWSLRVSVGAPTLLMAIPAFIALARSGRIGAFATYGQVFAATFLSPPSVLILLPPLLVGGLLAMAPRSASRGSSITTFGVVVAGLATLVLFIAALVGPTSLAQHNERMRTVGDPRLAPATRHGMMGYAIQLLVDYRLNERPFPARLPDIRDGVAATAGKRRMRGSSPSWIDLWMFRTKRAPGLGGAMTPDGMDSWGGGTSTSPTGSRFG